MNDGRKYLLFFSIVGMMVFLFFSRALLSVFMIAFVVIACYHKNPRAQLRNFLSSPVLWGMSLLFLMPLLSGLWSTDKKEWVDVLRIKLPLLVLPVAFAAPFQFSRKQWDIIAWIFLALVAGGSIWSMFHYASDMEAINESYLRAKSIATPLGNDHVRFSWLVSIAVLLCGWIWWRVRDRQKLLATIVLLNMAWLIIFLHLLAARTGLFSFYIMVLVIGTWLILEKAKLVTGIILLIALVSLPFVAYLLLPSFQNRVSYILYDYGHFSESRYLPGGNDAARVISLRAGWALLNKNPIAGIGAGDIPALTRQWDINQYPGMLDTDIIYPSSEWLIYGLTAGWPGVILFTAIMLVPFFYQRRPGLVWLLLHLTAAFSFLFDMGLEIQFGVFVYSFIVLWWWKWFKPQKEITLTDD
jgi:O-antigen ligase